MHHSLVIARLQKSSFRLDIRGAFQHLSDPKILESQHLFLVSFRDHLLGGRDPMIPFGQHPVTVVSSPHMTFLLAIIVFYSTFCIHHY